MFGRLAMIATLLLGCGPAPSPNEISGGPVVSCADPGTWTPPQPTLSCAAAIIAARRSLSGFPAPVVEITFEFGRACPPGARCGPPSPPNVGYVIFRFVLGPPVHVTVSMDAVTGIVSAGEAQPLPAGL